MLSETRKGFHPVFRDRFGGGLPLFVSQQERVGQGHLWNMLADGSIFSIAGLEDYRVLVPTILWGSSRVWFTPPGPGL